MLDAKIDNKRLSFGDITQKDKAKSFGAHSALQEVGVLSVTQKNQMTKSIQDRKNGTFGWRVLQGKFGEILGIPIKSHERARRISQELALKNRFR